MEQDFSQREFGLALWYVRHREHLRKTLIVLLIVFDVIVVGYVLIGVVRFIIQGQALEANMQTLVKTPTFHTTVLGARLPRELTLSSVTAITSGTRTDLVTLITNPNEHWGARLTGHFRVNGIARPSGSTVVRPSSDGAMIEFSVPGIGGAADFVVEATEWIPARSDHPLPTLSFPVKSVSSVVDERGTTRARVEIMNASPVGFREATFILLGFQGDRLVAANRLSRENLQPGESVTLGAAWTSPISTPSTFRLIPTMDIFDPAIYYLALPQASIDQ